MDYIRRPFDRLKRSDHARSVARSNLRAAKNADREQYLALAANYIDLSQTFLGCSFDEPAAERTTRMTRLFQGLWQNLPYAERLSDFEFMLAQALIESSPEKGSLASPEPLIVKLRQLAPSTRFALLAYTCGNWPLRWVALAMRIKGPALHQLLSEARCTLCDISWESLALEEQNCLESISVALDQAPNVRANLALSKRTQAYPRIMTIKAQWLELRTELVELRLRQTSEQERYEHLLTNILSTTADKAMQRPALVDRMLNTLHFSRHDKIKVS